MSTATPTSITALATVDGFFQLRLKLDKSVGAGKSGFVVVEVSDSSGKKVTEYYQSISLVDPSQDVYEELVAPIPKGHKAEIVGSYGTNPAVVKFVYLPAHPGLVPASPNLLCSGVFDVQPTDKDSQPYIYVLFDFVGNDLPDDVQPVLSCENGSGCMSFYYNIANHKLDGWFRRSAGEAIPKNTAAKIRYMFWSTSTASVQQPNIRAYFSEQKQP